MTYSSEKNNSLSITHPELAAQWHPTKNGSLTPNDVTAKNPKKVWWIIKHTVPETGKTFTFEWQAMICHRANGIGCPYLSGQAVWRGFNDLASQYPELAEEWHPTKNGSLTPADVTAGSNKKVWWTLPYDDPATGKHFNFEWQTTVSHRARGQKSPYLSGKAVWKGFNDLATTHPKLAAEWHPTKNGNFTPCDVTAGSNKKVWWLYSYNDPNTGKHFDFEWRASILNRANGNGCPYLPKSAMTNGFNSLAVTHPELAAEWHPTKNGTLTPQNVTADCTRSVWWTVNLYNNENGSNIEVSWLAPVASRVKNNTIPYVIVKGN
jgi:hypothetical protein